jgi:hypothetical protein
MDCSILRSQWGQALGCEGIGEAGTGALVVMGKAFLSQYSGTTPLAERFLNRPFLQCAGSNFTLSSINAKKDESWPAT